MEKPPLRTASVQNQRLEATVSALLYASQSKLQRANDLATEPNPGESKQEEILSLIQGALTDGRKAVEAQPDVIDTWINLSRVYRRLIGFGQNADQFAELTLQEAVKLEPENYLPYYELSSLYIQTKQYEKAKSNLLKAIELNPGYANLYFNLGFVYTNLGETEKAKAAYTKVLELLPKEAGDRKLAEQELNKLQ